MMWLHLFDFLSVALEKCSSDCYGTVVWCVVVWCGVLCCGLSVVWCLVCGVCCGVVWAE